MFRPEEIQARLREQPFRPFRLVVSEGLQYEVHLPELLLVGQRDIMVGFATEDRPKIYDRVIRVALVHLVGIEDLPASTSSSTNGPE